MILVGGQTNIDVDAPDDREARVALMRVLAHALRAERAPERLTVRTVDHKWTADQIAPKLGPHECCLDHWRVIECADGIDVIECWCCGYRWSAPCR